MKIVLKVPIFDFAFPSYLHLFRDERQAKTKLQSFGTCMTRIWEFLRVLNEPKK